VSDGLFKKLKQCSVGEQETIFGNSLSDHLPIIADFKDEIPLLPERTICFLNTNTFVFAKTTPEIPHEYLVRDNLSEVDKKVFDEFKAFVNKNGYTAVFQSKQNRYFNLNGYKYWFIGKVLNRERIKS
jgi:hypothetical protein